MSGKPIGGLPLAKAGRASAAAAALAVALSALLLALAVSFTAPTYAWADEDGEGTAATLQVDYDYYYYYFWWDGDAVIDDSDYSDWDSDEPCYLILKNSESATFGMDCWNGEEYVSPPDSVTVTWTSSDDSVLKLVSAEDEGHGTVRAKAQKEGVVTLTVATSTGHSDSFTVEVVSPGAMYRLYNPNSGEHFYTTGTGEAANLVNSGWNYEGVGWVAPTTSSTPVYRMYNPNPGPNGSGEHHYTTSKTERDSLVAAGWQDEGVGWYSDDAKTTPLYREYNPNEYNCNHNYTTNKSEHNSLVGIGWRDEGIAWYGI